MTRLRNDNKLICDRNLWRELPRNNSTAAIELLVMPWPTGQTENSTPRLRDTPRPQGPYSRRQAEARVGGVNEGHVSVALRHTWHVM